MVALSIFTRRAARSFCSSLHSSLAMSEENLALNAFFSPPSTVRGMTSLDRGLFTRAIDLPAIKLKNLSLTQKFLSHLSHVILKYPLFKKIVTTTDVDGKVSKSLLLLPEVLRPRPLSSEDHVWIAENDGEETTHTLCLTYPQSYSYHAILRAILPDTIEEVPTGYDTIGHIAHFNLKQDVLPFKNIIGQVVLDKYRLIKTVVNKIGIVENTFRVFNMEILAGEDNLFATENENGCSYSFDFSKVYWNSRLHTEHERLVNLLPKDGTVIDVFAGVGPFSLPAAKKGCRVHANDLNPHSYKYLCTNAKKNNVMHKVTTYNLDGKEFVQKVTAMFVDKVLEKSDRMYTDVIMNLPAMAYTFLGAFKGLFSSIPQNDRAQLVLPRIHCYCFSKCVVSPEQDSLKTVTRSLGVGELTEGTYSVNIVRNVAPNKWITRVSFQLPNTIAYAAEVNDETKTECMPSTLDVVKETENEPERPAAKRTKIE